MLWVALLLAAAPLAPVKAQDLLWARQTGSAEIDGAYHLAVDGAGNAYITGRTYGSLGGTNAGGQDAFLAKYDAGGTLLWMRQTGTTRDDYARGVAVDGVGNAYIAGWTYGSLGGTSAGREDIFLVKYDAAGTLLWTRQIGTIGIDGAHSVAVDGAGNAYITGQTSGSLSGPNAGSYDAFLSKYNAAGALLWTRQTGTAEYDTAKGVAVDGASNAYITGRTEGSLGGANAGGTDAFLTKYDAAGTLLWTRQTGTVTIDEASGVAVDGAGNAYIAGYTQGNLGGFNAGGQDAFLAKYDAEGTLLWTRQIGSAHHDKANDVAMDGAGNVYITGSTYDSLGGPNAGYYDAFLAKYDAAGTLLWTRQTGTAGFDHAEGVAVDGGGNVYTTGSTSGNLGGPNAGDGDIFLVKYGPSCTGASFISQPSSTATCPGGSASISVVADGSGPLTYQWQWREANEPNFRAVVFGANGVSGLPARFTVLLADQSGIDVREMTTGLDLEFRCIASNTCGSVVSDAATLTVCDADSDCSGDLGVPDIFAYLSLWFSGEIPAADFNEDQQIDVADIFAFLSAWFAGCP